MHRATVGVGLSHRGRPERRQRSHRLSLKVQPNARGLVRAPGFGYATQPHMRRLLTLAFLALLPLPAWAASERIAGALETELQPPAITTHQITQYLARRTPTPPVPWTSADWGAEARRLRRRLLEDVVLHGWPREWVSAPPRIEDLGLVDANGIGFVYLAMQRALDVLAQRPRVDASRLGVTGLSGGGWQSVVLGARARGRGGGGRGHRLAGHDAHASVRDGRDRRERYGSGPHHRLPAPRRAARPAAHAADPQYQR